MFVGRREEIDYLKRFYGMEGSQILVLYGTRGIGKTEILKEFTSGRRVTYYKAGAVSDREQRYEWARELKLSGYHLADYPDYEELFRTIFPENNEKKVLVIDEFQYMIKGSPGFFQMLSSFVDRRRMSRPIFVVLLSSAPGWVENGMVSAMGSQAGFINGIHKVKELSFRDICRLYPTYSRRDAFYLYAVLGGNPGLWGCLDPGLNFEENIKNNLLRKGSRLYSEMCFYFAEDLREPAVYNTILANIAQGFTKLNDLYDRTGFSRAKISVYLKNLMELNLIEKVCAGVYRITLPYMKFYFRFLFTNRGLMEKMSVESFYDKIIASELPKYVNDGYAKICRQHYAEENVDAFEISEWHEKDACLDLVTVDGETRRVAGICRYLDSFEQTDFKKLQSDLRHAKIKPDRLLLYSERSPGEELQKLLKSGKIELISLGLTGEEEDAPQEDTDE